MFVAQNSTKCVSVTLGAVPVLLPCWASGAAGWSGGDAAACNAGLKNISPAKRGGAFTVL